MTKPPLFEILDDVDTPLGPMTLRRRELLGRPGTIVTEVSVDMELLMSSLNTVSEEALSTRGVAWHGGSELRCLVGGLGLGYTAQAALDTGKVASVRVIERIPQVIQWLREGKLPLSERLGNDPRAELVQADVYALLLDPPVETWDLILIDVDHSPSETLDVASRPFYTVEGLQTVREHLSPGGVLAVWSVSEDDAFVAALAEVFAESAHETVSWVNELIDDGQEVDDVLFLARR
jgi:spermidine synthase